MGKEKKEEGKAWGRPRTRPVLPSYVAAPKKKVEEKDPELDQLCKVIAEQIRKDTRNYQSYYDLYEVSLLQLRSGSWEWMWKLSKMCEAALAKKARDAEFQKKLYALHRDVLRSAAPYHFESYLMFVEFNREPEKKFYMPRRRKLKPVVDALQDLADGKLKLLCISLPPGVGKTTLAIFFLTWLAGKHPEEPMLTGSHSNSFIRGVYDECLRIMDPSGEYLWREVFPKVKISNTNAKDCRIDLGKRKRFETLQFTSIGAGNAGLYRAMQLLYCDDLVSGIEVAMSKERLDKLWEQYSTDLRQRKIGDHCCELHIATRWSVHDVIGRLERMYAKDPEAKFISIPALNAMDESNFDYAYGVGFSTEVYREQREIMDDVSWRALYMNQPIEREGILYQEDELKRFYDLPSQEPDAVLAVCDTKDRGKDYCVMPILYQYGDQYYVEDCVCDNGKPEIVEARLVAALMKHKVRMARFESNSAGGKVAEKVQAMVKARGGVTSISTKFSTSNKETRIITLSPYVKEHFLFKSGDDVSKEYQIMLRMLCGYTMMGKNPHDDVPDAMAMAADYVQSFIRAKVEVFMRPF